MKSHPILWLLAGGALLLLFMKLFLGAQLDLYSDEIFYWLASTRLNLAYSDLPFMTALLVKIGSALDPGNSLAVRSLFILTGSCIPILIYWLAEPVTGRQRALVSAILALCIPLGGFLGLLAVPDVPLLFFGLLTIGFFERSLRTNRTVFWIATGLTAALGLATHYRFLLYPAAAMLFLLTFKPARVQWRNPKLWLAASLACLGLFPVLWFNFNHDLASASFYLVERHPWTFQPSGLLHPFKQAVLVTPPLYLLFGVTLWTMLGAARSGDRTAAMLSSFALVNLLVYLLLAPWTDSSSTSIRWPLSGYFPLLVFAPDALNTVGRWVRDKWNGQVARLVVIGIPALGFCGSVTALLVVGAQAYQAPMQTILGKGILSNKMAGWREFSTYTSRLLERQFPGRDNPPVIVTDNYYTAAQLAFAGLADRAFTLDDDKALRDGRVLQLQLWGLDASGLIEQAGLPALFVTEDSTLTVPDKEQVVGAMCHLSSNLVYLERLSLFNGEKVFSYYKAESLARPTGSPDSGARPCPFPARAWIDLPSEGATLSGISMITGWAYAEDVGVQSVKLLLNDVEIADLNYGAARPDVVEAMQVRNDPNAPDLGFEYKLDTLAIGNGEYTLSIKLIEGSGADARYGERRVEIRN